MVKEMREGDIGAVDVKEEVQKSFNNQLQKDLKNTVWASGCKSWYYSEDKGVCHYYYFYY